MNIDPTKFETQIISSEPSFIYCLNDGFSIEIYNNSFSKEISSGDVFENPLTFIVKNYTIYT